METEPQIIADYIATGKVRLVYRHLLQLGEGSQVSAEASECAGAQGKFWEMHNKLYAEQNRLYSEGSANTDTYVAIAEELGLDGGQLQQCMDEGQFREQVERDDAAAQAEGVIQRPVFDINGARLFGSQPYSQFQAAIDAALQ